MERTEAIEELKKQVDQMWNMPLNSGAVKKLSKWHTGEVKNGGRVSTGGVHPFDVIEKLHLLMVYLWKEIPETKLNDKEECKELDKWAEDLIEYGTWYIRVGNNEHDKLRTVPKLKEAYQIMGRRHFEKFLIAIEWNYSPDMKFYDIRKDVLREWTYELESLEYGVYKGLSISAPPRVGKTALGEIFFMWCGLRHAEKSCFFVSHTAAMADKVYNDILLMLGDEKREITKIFPNGIVIDKSAEQKYIRLKNDSSNPYHTFYFRGIDGNMAGVLEASWLLYCDDLIKNIEEAMNPDRLETARTKYGTDIRQRKSNKEVRELHIATRWSTGDVISTLEKDHKNDNKWKFIKKPALTEEGKSNFMYKHPYEMDEEYFLEQRNSPMMDEISFNCLYQQEPVEREGLWVTEESLHYFNGVLPEGECDLICSACDVAWGGGDYLSMPIAKVYGTAVYITDIVYNNGTKETTKPLVRGQIINNKIEKILFEANNGGDEYCDDIKKMLKEDNYKLDIRSQKSPTNLGKTARIQSVTDEVKGLSPEFQLYFLEPQLRNDNYKKFMKDLFKYNTASKFIGRQKDDCADSLAMLIRNVLEARVMKTEARSNFSRADLGF